jgi:outer membrane receptor protein involved in Fe transport
MTKAHGAHTLKWGANLIERRMMQFQSGSPKGSFSFDSNPTSNGAGSGGNSVASLLVGYPSSTSRSKTLYWPDFHGAEFGFYIPDDWRMSKRLTLNLGLRYDIITPLSVVHGQGCNLALGANSAAVACANGVNANLTTRSGGVAIAFNDFSRARRLCRHAHLKTVLAEASASAFFPRSTAIARECAMGIT